MQVANWPSTFPLDMSHCWKFYAKTSLALLSPHHSSQYLLRNEMSVHEVKHANVKHIAKIKLQFMVPILEILLLIQLQGENNLADLTPEIV